MPQPLRIVVIGAGPAGLTAACEALRAGFAVTVLEQSSDEIGGLSKTVRFKGNRFDIGGHRFFSKNEEIRRWWRERLPNDFLNVNRKSRILYRGRFFEYPLQPWNALRNLGPLTSAACVASYAWARLFPKRPEVSFEDWVSNRFGRRLFRIFFKTYTEKVWGVPCAQLSADWAAQRIKGLSLLGAVWNAFFRPRPKEASHAIKTLINTFEYPRLGPGQMWERAAADFQAAGGALVQGFRATRLLRRDGRIHAVEATDASGARRLFEADQMIASMPLRDTILALDPPPPAGVLDAARRLTYRDFLTVALVVEGDNPFPDNWIYVHEPCVRLGRIQNFRNWSPEMVARAGTTCLGLEYFCFEGDELWNARDEDLLALGRREISSLGLVRPGQIVDGTVVRMEKAYPVYPPGYQDSLAVIRRGLADVVNLQVVGRNGMHRYNNQDHSMMTGLLAVRNLQGASYDLWKVNNDAEYHEEGADGGAGSRTSPD